MMMKWKVNMLEDFKSSYTGGLVTSNDVINYRLEIIQILENYEYSSKFKLKFDGNMGVYKSSKASVIADFDFIGRLVRAEFGISGELRILIGTEYLKDILPVLLKIKGLYLEKKKELDLENKVNFDTLFIWENWINLSEYLCKYHGFNVFDIPGNKEEFKEFLLNLDIKVFESFLEQDKEAKEWVRKQLIA